MRISLKQANRGGRRGGVMVYVIVCLPAFVAMCALGVDVGRRQLAKGEAQGVADAAARYAATGMQSSSTPLTTARANANAVAIASRVDGAAPAIASSDVVRGTYNANGTFTANSTGDAVKVTVTQTLNRSGAPALWISLFTNSTYAVSATAVARTVTNYVEIEPPASGNLWLSGMPDNTQHKNFRPDAAHVWDNSGSSSNKKQRPLEINLANASMQPGDSIILEGISGTATYLNSNASEANTNTADGNAGYLVANGVAPASSVPATSANGMSNTRAPIGAVMAVFLTDNAPTSGSTPSNLDFGTAASRDYTSISPQVKQVFYIGDGKRSTGETQSIVIPAGATRMFVGMMDAWQWNDNTGNFKTKLYSRSKIYLVK